MTLSRKRLNSICKKREKVFVMTHAQTLEMIEMTNLYSDFHKDVYGFRPGADKSMWFRNLPYNEMKEEWDYLGDRLDEAVEDENREFDAAAVRYEAHIANLMTLGADREAAIRWDMEAEGCIYVHEDGTNYDWGYYRHKHGLRYNYLLNGEK